MEINKKLRQIRESKNLTQADMAEQLEIEPSTYAKLERGETQVKLDRLEKIAQILQVDIAELIKNDDTEITILTGDNYNYGQCQYVKNFYSDTTIELHKLQQELKHKDELLMEKDKLIAVLQNLVSTLQKNN